MEWRKLNSKLVKKFVDGIVSTPVIVAVNAVHPTLRFATMAFAAMVFGSGTSAFVGSAIDGENLSTALIEALVAVVGFFPGGFLMLVVGFLVKNLLVRSAFLILVCLIVVPLALAWMDESELLSPNRRQQRRISTWLIVTVIVMSMVAIVFLSALAE